MSRVILSTAYLPPLQFFSRLVSGNSICLEACENYLKQTYRNRCVILSANDVLPLSIPVIKTNGNHTPIRNVEIDNSSEWQKIHLRAIEAGYGSSPYFEFVFDMLYPFYSKKFINLFDFNFELIEAILKFLELKVEINLTTDYSFEYSESSIEDCRGLISPKVKLEKDMQFTQVQYYQVFAHKVGFVPNLSIIDMLFNEGLATVGLLKRMYSVSK